MVSERPSHVRPGSKDGSAVSADGSPSARDGSLSSAARGASALPGPSIFLPFVPAEDAGALSTGGLPGGTDPALSLLCPGETSVPARFLDLLGERLLQRARIIAGAIRTGHMLSAGMAGVIDETRLEVKGRELRLHLPSRHRQLNGERLRRRFNALGATMGLKSRVIATD